jgi:hypothetical protein
MSTTEPNNSLIDKVRVGSSPTLKNRRDRSSYGYKKSSEDAKIRIQKDILDSLKESDGLPALVYPQDYIFDIAHLRTNGNLGELIDDMSNIANPEERFEMVKSENRILRERLHNALQREMKAIKTFQKLAHDNRLMHLKLKEHENSNKARSLISGRYIIYMHQLIETFSNGQLFTRKNWHIKQSISEAVNCTFISLSCYFILTNLDLNEDESPQLVNGNDCSPTRTYNGKHRRQARLTLDNIQTRKTVDQSTSTTDLSKILRDQSTSTQDIHANEKDVRESDEDNEDKSRKSKLRSQHRRELFKAKSSPSIMKGIHEQILRY